LADVDLALQAPPKFSIQIIRMLSGKTAIAARIDACGTCSSGSEGRKFREEILTRFGKIIAPQ
jgi:RNA processing factor Prp31